MNGTTPAHTAPVLAGACLGERYTLTRLIGTGGMASVWVAHDPRLDRDVAIKVISDTLALDTTFVERFAREARIAAALSHPHVVGVFDYGTHGGRPYLVMEYVVGGTLSTRLKEGRTDWNEAALARDLLDALAHIHAAGILHRDLKPANVLLGLDGRARLTDFGIAHLADATKLTSTGYVVGTEKYLAPEVRRGGPATVASDLYALGVLLGECAPGLGWLIEALTDPDPARRPATASAARALLEGGPAAPPGRLPAQPAPTEPLAGIPIEAIPTEPIAAGVLTEPVPAATEPLTAGMPTAGMLTDGMLADGMLAEPVPAATEPMTPAVPTPATPDDGAPGATTAVLPDARPGPSSPRPAARFRGLGLVLAVVLAVIVVLAFAHRAGGGHAPLQLPPPGGSVAKQLDQLDASIDHARR